MGTDITNGYLESEHLPTTPNLNTLRDAGVKFTNTWATPQCTPTRAAIMSGKYGIKTGVMRPPGNLDLEHKSIFTKIKEYTGDTYASAVIGKWHISNPVDYNHPSQHGIDHYEGLFTAAVDDYYSWTKIENGEEVQVEEYVTTHFTDDAIDWVTEQDQPWFLWLAHVAPHVPFHIPPADLYTIENTEDEQGKYIAAIEAMDHEIGRLLENIDSETLANTVIIFIGDNGTPGRVIQGHGSTHAKASLYEGGLNVPMLISGKGVTRTGATETQLTQVTDLHATILELIGVQLPGGDYNSLSLKPLLSCADNLGRSYLYSDYENGNTLGYAIRNEQYKLIEYEDGQIEFYDLLNDPFEEVDLMNTLNTEQQLIFTDLQEEANNIRSDWSCNDGIMNGAEASIDSCDDTCTADNTTSNDNIGCCEVPSQPSVYYEYIEGNIRNIYTNNFPDHSYCYNSINQMPEQVHHNFGIDLNPVLAGETTLVIRDNGRPLRYFGVAKNGVIFAPAPAQPFIFENPNTGEYKWDWVFEATNNQGQGQDKVGLDCASAHTGPQGYHYHGNMFAYVDNIETDISTTNTVPESPIHIGWAADGFPILYRFGPDPQGQMKELLPSYQLQKGNRPGDGISSPCGAYSGKYTNDYEYICGKGDLDECNGIASNVSISTANGMQTFSYFYVVTATFPQISRCLKGVVSSDFDNNAPKLSGVDADNDGFLSAFDCDDQDPNINPLAEEIEGNDVDENCDGELTSNVDYEIVGLNVGPNPSDGSLLISYDQNIEIMSQLHNLKGQLVKSKKAIGSIQVFNLESGIYILKIELANGLQSTRKIIVE